MTKLTSVLFHTLMLKLYTKVQRLINIQCLRFVCNGRQTGFTTRDIVAENGHKNRSTLGVSCRSGIFGYLYMNEIMAVKTVLTVFSTSI